MSTKRKKKKERGRPMELRYPPRIDASPEELARILLNAGPATGKVSGRDYFCRDCGRQVAYPEVLYRDDRCEECHRAAA